METAPVTLFSSLWRQPARPCGRSMAVLKEHRRWSLRTSRWMEDTSAEPASRSNDTRPTINRVSFNYFGTPGYSLGHKNDFDGLYIRNVENARVTDSQFTGNERYGVELQAVHSSTVENSTMSFNGSMGGVSEQNFEGALDGPLVAQWIDNSLIANGSGGIDVETDPKLPPAQGIMSRNQVIDCGNDRW